MIPAKIFAGEGMWLPLYLKKLNEKKMKEMGLKISAEDIYNINHSSLKDAVVSLGGFCTAEFVSSKGLLFTNHHCGYDKIAGHSTVEHDYLEEGFWAKSNDKELPNPDLTASRLVRMEEVTGVIVPAIDTIENPLLKEQVKSRLIDSLKKSATEGTHYSAEIKSMYYGNEYYLSVYEVFQDVRLVGAPPSDIGKFGGDTDNWMWPRHTGDFSVFRVYVGPGGKPAPYSEDNVPYQPKELLEISLDGYKKNDFSMIYGFPGRTERYLTSYDIAHKMNIEQPTLIRMFDKMLAVKKAKMEADSQAKIQLASDYASLSNYHKYLKGQLKGLKDYDLLSRKQENEKAFLAWVNEKEARKEKYGNIFNETGDSYKKFRSITPGFYYFGYGMFRVSLVGQAFRFSQIESQLSSDEVEEDKLNNQLESLNKRVMKFLRNGYPELDQKTLTELLVMYYKNTPESQHPEYFKEIMEENDGEDPAVTIREYLQEEVYEETMLLDSQEVIDFFEKPKARHVEKDPLIQLIGKLVDHYRQKFISTYRSVDQTIEQQLKLYVAGMREWKENKKFYPDANFTMRLSYGVVEPYKPRDAVYYHFYTTQEGILHKEDPDDEEFDVPGKLKELLSEGDFGPYGEKDTLKVCFLTDNDITGGNSGSPVMNGKGQLIGLAFDGNWEAMTGDLVVIPELNRTINVDIRYVLFIMDEFADADNLLAELSVLKDGKKMNLVD